MKVITFLPDISWNTVIDYITHIDQRRYCSLYRNAHLRTMFTPVSFTTVYRKHKPPLRFANGLTLVIHWAGRRG